MYEDSFKLGVELAAKQYGLTVEDILVKKAAEDIVSNSFEEQQLYSRAGANVLALSGDTSSEAYKILCKCASFDRLLSKESQKAFIEPVKQAFTKQASLLGAVGSFIAKGLGSLGTLAGIATIATGAATGAAAWGARRAITTDDEAVEAKFKQAKKYQQLAREIRNNLQYLDKQQSHKAIPKNENHSDDYMF